jgi:uncharacterized protein
VTIFFRRRIRDYALARADNPTRTRTSRPITVVFGAVLGVLVSLCSVGAGALGVAVLFFLYPRLPPVRIVGSDLAHAVPLTLVAGLGYWLIGSADWYIAVQPSWCCSSKALTSRCEACARQICSNSRRNCSG